MSLMKMMNKRGPSTLLWGTPDTTSHSSLFSINDNTLHAASEEVLDPLALAAVDSNVARLSEEELVGHFVECLAEVQIPGFPDSVVL